MKLSKFKDLDIITTLEDLDEELFLQEKALFDLAMRKKLKQSIKPHFFVQAKRRISQLKLKKSHLLEQIKSVPKKVENDLSKN